MATVGANVPGQPSKPDQAPHQPPCHVCAPDCRKLCRVLRQGAQIRGGWRGCRWWHASWASWPSSASPPSAPSSLCSRCVKAPACGCACHRVRHAANVRLLGGVIKRSCPLHITLPQGPSHWSQVGLFSIIGQGCQAVLVSTEKRNHSCTLCSTHLLCMPRLLPSHQFPQSHVAILRHVVSYFSWPAPAHVSEICGISGSVASSTMHTNPGAIASTATTGSYLRAATSALPTFPHFIYAPLTKASLDCLFPARHAAKAGNQVSRNRITLKVSACN